MKKMIVGCLFFSSVAHASLPPPQGKSIPSDNQYSVDEKQYSWFDIAGRMEHRNKLKEEAGENPTRVPDSKAGANKSKTESRHHHQSRSEKIVITQSSAETLDTNLPNYYQGIDRSSFKASDKVMY